MKTWMLDSRIGIAMSCAIVLLAMSSCNGGGASSSASNVCSTVVKALAQDHGSFLDVATAKSETSLKQLHGHVPRAVKESSDLGKTDEGQVLPITVALELNNQADLAQELSDLYQPGNPKYGQFLTPQEFRTKYGPTEEQIQNVQTYLQNQGLNAISVDPSGLFIHAMASNSTVGSAFHTEVHQYNDASGKSFHAPAYEVQIPQGLQIQAVHGLENHSMWHSHATMSKDSAAPRAGTGPSGGLSPTDIRAAYNVPAALDGSGQTLAVFELDGYTASDIAAYESNFGIPSVPLQNVLVDGATGSAGGGAGEVTLDIELMTVIAPKASKIMVYEGVNDSQSILNTYARIATDNLAKSVSTSWGSSEAGNTSAFAQSENTIFTQMAAQGQSIFSAAGDNGADDNGSSLSVDDPSSQPYVTGVGGTKLTLGASSAYGSETTWNSGSSSGGAGGGGISTIWSIPSWQKGVASASNKASSTMRNIPDVALESDISSGYSIYEAGGWSVWGGTSCAAPLWAAFTALVNQQRASNGLSTIGYMNPLLYQIGSGARYDSDFHDIKDGSTNLFYPAVSGYDDATGWGSFNATNLIQDLAQATGGNLNPTSTLIGAVNSCSRG